MKFVLGPFLTRHRGPRYSIWASALPLTNESSNSKDIALRLKLGKCTVGSRWNIFRSTETPLFPRCFQASGCKACLALASYSWFMMQETHVFFYSVAPCWMLQQIFSSKSVVQWPLPFHLQWGVVWAAGIKQNELTNQLKSSLLELNQGVSETNVKLGSCEWTNLGGLTWPDVCPCNKVVLNALLVGIVSSKLSAKGVAADPCEWHHHWWLVTGAW